MATLQQIRDKANDKLATLWSVLQTKQEAYFAKHGRYFQLLGGGDVVDGVDTLFTPVSPPDEKHAADVDYSWSDTLPFKLEVHEWMGNEAGYIVIATIKLLDDRIFERRRNSLNEDTGWVELLEDVIYTPPQDEPWPNLTEE